MCSPYLSTWNDISHNLTPFYDKISSALPWFFTIFFSLHQQNQTPGMSSSCSPSTSLVMVSPLCATCVHTSPMKPALEALRSQHNVPHSHLFSSPLSHWTAPVSASSGDIRTHQTWSRATASDTNLYSKKQEVIQETSRLQRYSWGKQELKIMQVMVNGKSMYAVTYLSLNHMSLKKKNKFDEIKMPQKPFPIIQTVLRCNSDCVCLYVTVTPSKWQWLVFVRTLSTSLSSVLTAQKSGENLVMWYCAAPKMEVSIYCSTYKII